MNWFNTDIPAANLQVNGMLSCRVDGREVILTLHDGRPTAFSAICPHASGELRQGEIYRGRIDCPVHSWRFDIKTGQTLYPPDEHRRLSCYAAKIEDGIVWVGFINKI